MTGQVPEDTRSHAQQWVQFSRTWAVMGWIPKDTRSHAQSRMAVSLVLEDVGGHPRVWARSPRTGAVTHRGELGSREQARLQLPGSWGSLPVPESSPLALSSEKQGSEWQFRHL